MQFAHPEYFWVTAAAGGVLLAHLVRRRARRHPVPFLALWAAAVSDQRRGLGSRILRYLDLLLVCLACLATGFAAAGPYVPGRTETIRDLVLVVDGGLELAGGERNRLLVQVAMAEIHRRAPGTRFVIVRVHEGVDVAASCPDINTALVEVRRHKPTWRRRSWEGAAELARAAAPGLRDPDLVFCTYRRARPEGFRLRTVRQEVANAGIADLEVVGDAEGGGHLARLTVRGRGEVSVGDTWSGVVTGTTVVDVPLPAEGEVELHVKSEGDRFPYDDKVWLLLPERTMPRVIVVAEKDPSPFLISALQALEGTGAIRGPLQRTTPDRVDEVQKSYDVLILDRCAPESRVARTPALYIAPKDGAFPFRVSESAEAPALFDLAHDHELMKGLDFARIPPLRARAIHGGNALASAAPGVALAAGANWVALGFDPDRCIFASTPSYPLFLRNVIEFLAKAAPVSESEFFKIGERAPQKGLARLASGRSIRVEDRLVGPPGIWELNEQRFAVNLIEPGLDLRPADEDSDPLPHVGEAGTPDRPRAGLFAAIAVGFLAIAWWMFWRR